MKDTPADSMKMMSEMTGDMSKQIMKMSNMMGKGMMSEKEMKTMRDQMMHMQKRMDAMEGKK